jgi:hypothetical protein
MYSSPYLNQKPVGEYNNSQIYNQELLWVAYRKSAATYSKVVADISIIIKKYCGIWAVSRKRMGKNVATE